MKKTMYIVLLTVFTVGFSYAQSLSQTVIGSSGATITGASNSLGFTAGEAAVGDLTNGVNLGQGFWLGATAELVLNTEDFLLEIQTSVFPNPVTDYLNLSFNEMVGEDFEIMLYDINGRMIFQKKLLNASENETLNFTTYSSGMYVLNIVQSATNKSKTVKIIKD